MTKDKISVFISYTRGDMDFVERVGSILEKKGMNVFIDRKLKTGEDFREKLVEQLGSSDVVITFWSKSSIKSRWVIDEAEVSLAQGMLVPVLIDGTLPPFGFGDINAVDLSEWDDTDTDPAILKLLEAIEWVAKGDSLSLQEKRNGLNEILPPLPRKDYREFKSSQSDLNTSVHGIFSELLELQEKTSASMMSQNDRLATVTKLIQIVNFIVIAFLAVSAYKLLSDISIMARSMDREMGEHMSSLANNMKNITINIDHMSANIADTATSMDTMMVDINSISKNIDKMAGDMDAAGPILTEMTSMNQTMKAMTQSVGFMTYRVSNRQRDKGMITLPPSQPMNFINSRPPWYMVPP
jgi:methyl-accepting chemotaxis protein